MSPWCSFLFRLQVGRPAVVRGYGVTLVPIFDPDPRPLEAFPLRWGIANGKTRVTEVGDGRVDRVCVEHDGATPILVLDGEEVVGAKQNRMFNASFLVPPQQPTVLPVSCVERKRWRDDSVTFTSSSRTVVTTVRSTKLRRVATSVVTRGEYDSGQREVWRNVESYIERTNVVSRTAAYADAADQHLQRINAAIDDIELDRGQVGVAAISADGQLTLDAFGSPGLFNRTWRVVARGLLGESTQREPAGDCAASVRDLLDRLCDTEPSERPAPGIGRSLFALANETTAGAIAHGGRIYHLVAAARYSA